jgi:hypothetical protein
MALDALPSVVRVESALALGLNTDVSASGAGAYMTLTRIPSGVREILAGSGDAGRQAESRGESHAESHAREQRYDCRTVDSPAVACVAEGGGGADSAYGGADG